MQKKHVAIFSCMFMILQFVLVYDSSAQASPTLSNSTIGMPVVNLSASQQGFNETVDGINSTNETVPITTDILQIDNKTASNSSRRRFEKVLSNNETSDQIIVAYDPIKKNVIIKNQDPLSPIPDNLNKIYVSHVNIINGRNIKSLGHMKNNEISDQTFQMVKNKMGIDISDNCSQIEFELDDIDRLLSNDTIKSVLGQYNITRDTSNASITQHNVRDAVIVNLNNKLDGTWYRLTAVVPEDREIGEIIVRYDNESTRVITDWTRNGTTVWFYDDPASVYEITTFKSTTSDATEQTITFPAGGGSNGTIVIEVPRSANIIDMKFDINTSDTLTHLSLDVGSNEGIEWGPINFSSSNGTVTLDNSNAGLTDALNALIPRADVNAIGVNYTYNENSNNVTIELNFSADSQGSLRLSNIHINYTLWRNLYGNVSGNIELSDDTYDLNVWPWNGNEGNVYMTDIDSIINWSALRGIGKKIDGSAATTDFFDLSQNWYMQPGVNISDAFSSDGTYALATATFTIYGHTVENVPLVNSTDRNNQGAIASSDFITGILWDSSDDTGNNEYDAADNEDIVFITGINKGATSAFISSAHDYEFIVPANFGSYKGVDDRIVYYVELK